MKYENIFHLIFDVLQTGNVPALVVGGFAVNYHGVSRQTQDIDLLMTEENYEKVKSFFGKAGSREVIRNPLFVHLENKAVSPLDLDVIFVDPKTFDGINREAKTTQIGGRKFKVPSLRHLLALKLHAMKQNLKRRGFRDLTDVLDLAQKNQIDVQGKDFLELCRQYGGEEICKTLQELLLKKWKS